MSLLRSKSCSLVMWADDNETRIHISGEENYLVDSVVSAARRDEKFKGVLQAVLLKMSLKEIDDLLEKRSKEAASMSQ